PESDKDQPHEAPAAGEGTPVAEAETRDAERVDAASGAEGHADTSTVSQTPDASAPKKYWYVVKVQSGREESIKEAIERRVKIEGLEEYFGQVIIPTERSVEMKNGKRVVRERKLYPGYLMVEVEYNDRMLYLFRETSG